MKLDILQGKTSKRIAVFIQSSISATNGGLTGLTSGSAGLVWYYWREDTGNAGGVAVTLSAATRGTWTSGGFIEIDATNMPGFYELGVPDAALASGSTWCVMSLQGATNMDQNIVELELTAYDPYNATTLGLTNLDATISSRTKPADTQAAVTSVVSDVGITQAAADKVFGTSGAVISELSQAQPPATPRPGQAVMLLYMSLRNLLTTTATTKAIANDAGTVIAKKALSDDGTTYTETKMVSGP